jgi:hypothetical protein
MVSAACGGDMISELKSQECKIRQNCFLANSNTALKYFHVECGRRFNSIQPFAVISSFSANRRY